MKKIGFILAILTFAIMMAGIAQAIPLAGNNYTGIFFRDNEVFIDNGQDPLTVQVGDQFWGVLDAQTIINAGIDNTGQSGSDIWPGQAPAEITGYFAMEVASVQQDFFGTGLDKINYGVISSDPNGILNTAAGEIFAIFEDNANNYNTSTRALGLATATDSNSGTATWTMGIAGGGYFYTTGSDIVTIGPVGTTYAGLNFITGGPLVTKIDDPNEVIINSLVDIWFNSQAYVARIPASMDGAADGRLFDLNSNDPAVLYPIPEPTSMLLLGTGLVGLAGASRRRRKAAKK